MSEPYVIKMPQLSDTMTEGVMISWEKQIGDEIKRGDIVASVETDKAIMDVEVFRDGYLSGPLAAIESTVPVEAPIAYIVATKEEVKQGELEKHEPAEAAPAPGGIAAAKEAPAHVTGSAAAVADVAEVPAGKSATPYARKLAAQRGVDLGTVNGSGPDGAIVAADIEAAAGSGSGGGGVAEAPVAGDGRAMSSLEKAIANTMASSITMPTFTMTAHIVLGSLMRAAKRQGVSVTVAVAKACALAMEKHPNMNWCYQPTDRLVERSKVDIGLAVAATDGGLVVPILRACETRDIADLNNDWKDLVGRARERRLKPEEFTGATFMVSNMGMFGVSQFDAIPTPGLGTILAISAEGPQGSPFTITADHRVVNGAHVGAYLNTLKGIIESPDVWLSPTGSAIPEGDWDYDVVVIGGGPGGEDCARDLVGHGLKVALVNDSAFPGGECLWRGCIPSKAWRAAADHMRDRANDPHLGVEGTNRAKLNWNKLEATRRSILETRGEMARKTDKGVRIAYLQGFGRFVDGHTLLVDKAGNQSDPHVRSPSDKESPDRKPGGSTLSFGCAVIATGAPPFIPAIRGAAEGLKNGGVLTSDTVWGLSKAPKRVMVVGGGAIGVEMAQIFQDFGARVTLVEALDRLLAEVEPEIAKNLVEILNEDPRLSVHTSATVQEIKGKPGSMTTVFQTANGNKERIKTDYVIMATGKRPVLDGLGLDKAGVDIEKGIIPVDIRGRTNVDHIFAVGDVVGGLMLAHTAGQQGRVAAATMLGENRHYDQEKDCGVIFTRPQAAFVGLSLEQAKAKGMDAVEIKTPMKIDAKAMIANELHGMIKMVVDKPTRRIVGVHFLADHADTLIGEAVMMVSCDLTLDQVAEAIHAHPTQTEMFGDMARRLLSRLNRSAKRKVKAG